MSDLVMKSYSDCDERNEKSMHSVQSVWMARWTRTSYNATAETHNHAPTKENDRDSKPLQSIIELETMSKLSKSIRRLRESETRTFEVINESLRTSSRTITRETRGAIVTSRPLLENPSRSASHIVPYQDPGQYVTKEGEKTWNPFISRSSLAGKDVPRLRMLDHEHNSCQNRSTSLACEDKLDSRLGPGSSSTPYLRQKDTFLQDVPSTSSKSVTEFGAGCSFIRLFQNESKELHPRSYDQQKLPHPLHDVETRRIGNPIDSVTGLPHISQKKHSLLVTKRTDTNLCDENKVAGNSRMWREFKEEASSSDHDSPSKSFGHHQGGIKLQLLDCSMDTKGKKNVEDTKPSEDVLKNESSAETDTMDIDVFQEKNQLCGSSSSTKKVNKMDQNSSPRLALDCSRKEAGSRKFNLDINLELPAPSDNVEQTSSRTESLDLESILAHAERPSSSKTEALFGEDPSSRWVKRLKLGASGSLAFGTKSSSFTGDSSHEKAHKFLSKITKASITSSDPTSSKHHGKELMAHNNTLGLTMNSSPSTGVIKKDLELLTSHSWVQRLLHDRATTAHKSPKPVVVCEPRSSKLEADDFQKKQLPSLGAMALMGKAMNGIQPCEFQRRGPLVVWNSF